MSARNVGALDVGEEGPVTEPVALNAREIKELVRATRLLRGTEGETFLYRFTQKLADALEAQERLTPEDISEIERKWYAGYQQSEDQLIAMVNALITAAKGYAQDAAAATELSRELLEDSEARA